MARKIDLLEAPGAECCPSVLTAPSTKPRPTSSRGFNALGDPVRLRVLSLLAAAPSGEICVCDFIGPIGKTQGPISHHLRSAIEP